MPFRSRLSLRTRGYHCCTFQPLSTPRLERERERESLEGEIPYEQRQEEESAITLTHYRRLTTDIAADQVGELCAGATCTNGGRDGRANRKKFRHECYQHVCADFAAGIDCSNIMRRPVAQRTHAP